MQTVIQLRGRRTWVLLATLALVLTGVYVASPGQAAVPLSASTFDAEDGNQVDDGDGETDWVDLGVTPIFDNAIGKSDNSLAGGTKDDTECPSTTTGSIPPNKDDLRHWYFDSAEVDNAAGTETDIFFYLAYVREVGSDTASAHGVFELNQASGGCPDIPGKGNQAPTPSLFNDRTDDDVRLLFDYEGGDNPVISYQLWDDTAKAWSSPVPLPPAVAVGSVNEGNIVDALNGNAPLTNREFAEAKINMSEAGLIPEGDCEPFAEAGLFTGASGNSDQEQSKDFIAPALLDFDFCGDLRVEKYIDVDQDGDEDDPGDVVDMLTDTEGDLDGWSFSVFEDGADPTTATPVCTGTTNDEGVVLCEDLDVGDYDVYENLASSPSGFINTDPGTTPIRHDATVEQGQTTTVKFGNTCQITKTFQVLGVPNGSSNILAWYDTATGDNVLTPASVTYVTLAPVSAGSTTWSGVASEKFDIGDSIEWGYGVDGNSDGDLEDAVDEVDFEGDETFTTGYPTCAKTNDTNFAPPSLTVRKFKDITADGLTTDDTQKLGGWVFDVYRDGGDGVQGDPDGPNPEVSDDTFVQQVTTAASTDAGATPPTVLGEAVVTAPLPIGTYFVVETDQANWTPTGSGPGDTDVLVETVVLNLSDTKTADFANAPEISFDVDVTHPTTHTQTDSITCTKTAGTNAGSVTDTDATADGFSSGNKLVGTYQCTIVVSDP